MKGKLAPIVAVLALCSSFLGCTDSAHDYVVNVNGIALFVDPACTDLYAVPTGTRLKITKPWLYGKLNADSLEEPIGYLPGLEGFEIPVEWDGGEIQLNFETALEVELLTDADSGYAHRYLKFNIVADVTPYGQSQSVRMTGSAKASLFIYESYDTNYLYLSGNSANHEAALNMFVAPAGVNASNCSHYIDPETLNAE